jgi:hypothetical protein
MSSFWKRPCHGKYLPGIFDYHLSLVRLCFLLYNTCTSTFSTKYIITDHFIIYIIKKLNYSDDKKNCNCGDIKIVLSLLVSHFQSIVTNIPRNFLFPLRELRRLIWVSDHGLSPLWFLLLVIFNQLQYICEIKI